MHHYPLFQTRRVHCCDGAWDLSFLGCDIDPEMISAADLKACSYDDRMAVPGVVDTLPRYLKQRGCFALRHQLRVSPGQAGLLRCGALGLWARIFVDGQPLGTCQTPYAPFQVDIPASDQVLREVVILVDSRIDAQRVPLFDPFFDFYGYGGVYRSVYWHELPTCAIERVAVTPQGLDGTVAIAIRLRGEIPQTITTRLAFDDGELGEPLTLQVQNGIAEYRTQVPGAQLWSPDAPHLHTLRVAIDGDDCIERFGIRTVSCAKGRILLNGQPLKLLGYNRHEAHPQFGPALPLQQLVHDLHILKGMGCNFVRGSHYPQDQRFLDLCDELGFVVWEEGLGWGTPARHLTNQRFGDLQAQQVEAMIRTSINHPSILLWGFLNECESHLPESTPLLERLCTLTRLEDPSRLVTFASNHPFEDLNLHLVDVISINQYPGWYPADRDHERPLHEIEPLIDRLIAHFADCGFADKPFIISEMGAGAIYGWRDELEAHWSEQYQAAYLDILCRRCVADERISGLAIWQFCDCRTYADGHALGRPRAFNNKGSFDEYRRPKMAAATVRAAFSGDGNR